MRRLVDELSVAFEKVHLEALKLIEENDFAALTAKTGMPCASACELVVKSAASVEQCCGGITTRLWDDPFEWTLPEAFPDKHSVIGYLEEVAALRNRAFAFIESDADLVKEIPAPEQFRSLFSILLDSLTHSSKYLHLAAVVSNSEGPECAPW